jgi:hypothetical protein
VDAKVRRKLRTTSIAISELNGSQEQVNKGENPSGVNIETPPKGQNLPPQGRLYVGVVQSIEKANNGITNGGWIKGGNARRTKLAFQGSDIIGESFENGDLVQYRAWRNESGQWIALQVRKVNAEEAARLDSIGQTGEAVGAYRPQNNPPSSSAQVSTYPRSPARIRPEKGVQRFFKIAAGPSVAPGAGFPVGRGKPILLEKGGFGDVQRAGNGPELLHAGMEKPDRARFVDTDDS